MVRSRHSLWLLAAVLLVACVARISAGLWWQAQLPDDLVFFFGDSHSYWSLAKAIALGEPYQYAGQQLFRAPGMPLLLSPLFVLFGADASPGWGRVVVALAGTLSVAATYWLGRSVFNSKVGLLAAAIVAVYPTNVFLGGMVLSEAPFAAAMLGQLACWILAWQQRERLRWFILCAASGGVAAGIACLIRPSWLLFTPLALMVAVVCCTDRLHHLKLGAIMLLTLAVTMSLWTVRNYQVADRFVPTSLQVGASLYDGLSPAADGGSDMEFVAPLTARYTEEWKQLPAERPNLEVYIDARFRADAIAWARAHPAQVAYLAFDKFMRTWNVWPNADEFRSPWMRAIVLVTYTPLMLLALLGLWRCRANGWPILLCCLPVLYLGLLHLVFVGSIRYREPALMPLAVLAAAWLVTQLGGKDARHLSAHD